MTLYNFAPSVWIGFWMKWMSLSPAIGSIELFSFILLLTVLEAVFFCGMLSYVGFTIQNSYSLKVLRVGFSLLGRFRLLSWGQIMELNNSQNYLFSFDFCPAMPPPPRPRPNLVCILYNFFPFWQKFSYYYLFSKILVPMYVIGFSFKFLKFTFVC